MLSTSSFSSSVAESTARRRRAAALPRCDSADCHPPGCGAAAPIRPYQQREQRCSQRVSESSSTDRVICLTAAYCRQARLCDGEEELSALVELALLIA